MSKLGLRLKEIRQITLLYLCKFAALPVRKKTWVICERGDDARDNAYWLYDYIKRCHKEQKVTYIMDRRSPDYEKVKEDAVQPDSLRHYWALATAQKLISTHYGAGTANRSIKLFRFCRLHKRHYFLQHGITRADLPQLYGDAAPTRLFVCGAKPEYDFIKERFGHPDGVVRYLGFARFDRLHDAKPGRQILVMPTWRSYLKTKEQFLSSSYFSHWQGLLENEALLQMLEEQDLQLFFYPHYEMQKYMDCFRAGSDRITLARFEDYDVQTLLKESAVLVTDYSSVYFDFAYMRKPVVYYQFDAAEFYAGHYRQGYFDEQQMGFGPVCAEEEKTVESLCALCHGGMEQQGEYLRRAEAFFPLYDGENCARIYEAIAGDHHGK